MTPEFDLYPIDSDGKPAGFDGAIPKSISAILEHTASLYQSPEYASPWLGYLAISDETIIGYCTFKSPPRDGAVEIAYACVPDMEGKGVATEMARRLINLAMQSDSVIAIRAQTLPEENASTAILRKLGFENLGVVSHPDDGDVWEWRLTP